MTGICTVTGQVKKGDKQGHAHSRLGAEWDEKRWGKGISGQEQAASGPRGAGAFGEL